MEITALELALAVVAVFIVFGPKRMPRTKSGASPAKHATVETTVLRPAYPAARRAPSPLQARPASRAQPQYQFGSAQSQGAALPHEYYLN